MILGLGWPLDANELILKREWPERAHSKLGVGLGFWLPRAVGLGL